MVARPGVGRVRAVAAAEVVATARHLADTVLFPAAPGVDRAAGVPASHLDALAGAGLYGLKGPPDRGGLGLDGPPAWAVVEALAGGCLATTFVWVQHHRLVRALAEPEAPAALRDEWLGPLCAGAVRAGVALGGLLPGPAPLRAAPAGDDWVVDGESPWVTGWGLVDVVLLAARHPGGGVAWLLVDAVEGPALAATRQRLVAVDASATVRLGFAGLRVPGRRLLGVDPPERAAPAFALALRTNGSLALGVAGRCLRLLGASPLDAELAACRAALDAGGDGMPAARAAASELALRASAALVVHDGSRAISLDAHPQRLAREALFLLVFGTRPPIKAALLERLAGEPPA